MKHYVNIPLKERGEGLVSHLIKVWKSTTLTFPDVAQKIIEDKNSLKFNEFIGAIMYFNQEKDSIHIKVEYYYRDNEGAKKYEVSYSYPIIMQLPNYITSELETSNSIRVSFELNDLLEIEKDIQKPIRPQITYNNLLCFLNDKFQSDVIKVSVQDVIFYNRVVATDEEGKTKIFIFTAINKLPIKYAELLNQQREFSINL